ncbi:hypothetical protein D1871_02275 [Nakamurella silvestris]|nr:hypothetical protein D1871_02275 [Nakamurella silvestris]
MSSVPRDVPVISPDGDYCAYNGVTEIQACVDDPADIEYAYAATEEEPSGRSVSAAASVVLGRFFDDVNYATGLGFIDYLGAGACTASLTTRDAGWSPLGTWANRISSFQGYNSCSIRLWTGVGYTGTSLSYRTTSANVGTTLNNNSESVEFS